jgi:hypothetical protein
MKKTNEENIKMYIVFRVYYITKVGSLIINKLNFQEVLVVLEVDA